MQVRFNVTWDSRQEKYTVSLRPSSHSCSKISIFGFDPEYNSSLTVIFAMNDIGRFKVDPFADITWILITSDDKTGCNVESPSVLSCVVFVTNTVDDVLNIDCDNETTDNNTFPSPEPSLKEDCSKLSVDCDPGMDRGGDIIKLLLAWVNDLLLNRTNATVILTWGVTISVKVKTVERETADDRDIDIFEITDDTRVFVMKLTPETKSEMFPVVLRMLFKLLKLTTAVLTDPKEGCVVG